jgi:hypothetical protein
MAKPDASIESWIDDAFDRLPIILTHRNGVRIQVVWHDEPRAFGTGSTDDEIVDEDGIHLFVPQPLTKRAVQRAVAFSLVWSADAELGWSASGEWMAQNGWRAALSSLLSPSEHSSNLDPRGYADERGRESARADLASFAAQYFFPDPGDDIRCRLLSQARFLGERLRLPERRCDAFERWARLSEIEAVDVALAAPTSRAAESLFGHLLMLLKYDSGEQRSIGFAAETNGGARHDPFFAIKGLFGGFRARLMERSFEDVYRDYVVIEGRDLRRWRLNLSKEETRMLLERVWTLERSGAYYYYFVGQNCASLLVELFNSVLPTERRIVHEGPGRAPGSALDGLQFARAFDGGPLATYVPDTLRSFARQAREADRKRSELADELARSSPEAAEAFAAIASADADARAAGYRRLAHIGLPSEAVDRYLVESLSVESHLMAEKNGEIEAARFEERRLRVLAISAALAESLPHDLAFAEGSPELHALLDEGIERLASEDPLERRIGYQALLALVKASELQRRDRDPEMQRRLRMVEHGARAFALLTAVRMSDPKPKDELQLRDPGSLGEVVAYAYVTEVSPTVLAIARARKEVGAPKSNVDREANAIAEEELRYRSASPHTGVDRLSLRGSNRGLVISGAFYDEALGDRRRHGLASDTALTIGASDVVWSWSEGRPRVMESQLRVLGFRTLRQAFDVEGPLLSRIGFELAVDVETMRNRGEWYRGEARAGVLLPILASDDLSDHLLVRAGVSAQGWLIRDATDAGGIGIPLGLEVRFEMGPVIANLDVGTAPLIDPWVGQIHLLGSAQAGLRIPIYDRLALPWRGHVGISFEASARATYSEIPNAEGLFARVDAGVRIE